MSQHFMCKLPNSVIATAGKERSDRSNAIASFPSRGVDSDMSQICTTLYRSKPNQLEQQAPDIVVHRFGFPTLAYDRREFWMRKPANVVDQEHRTESIVLAVRPHKRPHEVLSCGKGKCPRIAKGGSVSGSCSINS